MCCWTHLPVDISKKRMLFDFPSASFGVPQSTCGIHSKKTPYQINCGHWKMCRHHKRFGVSDFLKQYQSRMVCKWRIPSKKKSSSTFKFNQIEKERLWEWLVLSEEVNERVKEELSTKQKLPRQHFKNEYSQTPPINSKRMPITGNYFGSKIIWCSTHCPCSIIDHFAKSKICQLDMPSLIQ